MMQSYPEQSTEALVDISPGFENKRNDPIHQSLGERKLPPGVWGGENIHLEVSDAGATGNMTAPMRRPGEDCG